MASKFMGRDYSTLRQEIIEFLRQRLPNNWDYTNIADPVIIYVEALARLGDQLHYTIDELRRECDVATAKRASSIYSYAMREGYKMALPRGSFGTLSINTTKLQSGKLHLKLHQFDEIKVNPLGESLYVVDANDIDAILYAPVDKDYVTSLKKYEPDPDKTTENDPNRKKAMSLYQSYFNDIYNKTQHVKVVLGTKTEFPFTYNDINNDSTVELPNPFIDRNLVRLWYSNKSTNNKEKQLNYVDDVISSGFNFESFTLTPKFIGGAITLCVEFPTNYRDIFNSDTTTQFRLEYINIKNSRIEPNESLQDNAEAVTFPDGAITVVDGYEEDVDIVENGMQYRVSFGDGIKGYTEYENALVTRDNYKRFVQNYSALLTKDDYTNYIEALTHSHCKVYDHGDMYKIPSVLPPDSSLIPRAIYVLTDSNYKGREDLWNDLKERSGRSDCIVMVPYGKDPYTIVVKAECYLVGTSIASVATQIERELVMYYDGYVGEKIPKTSMVNYLVHKASDKVVRMECAIVRDSTYGLIDTTFNKVNQLDNDQIDELYKAFTDGDINYKSPIDVTDTDKDYYLRGVIYKDANGKTYSEEELYNLIETQGTVPKMAKYYYNKYPPIVDKNGYTLSEYNDYPDDFPRIYYIGHENALIEINEYDKLINYQIGYGELDSEDWDFADTDIFKITVDDSFIISDYFSENNSLIVNINDTNYYTRTDTDDLKIRSRIDGETTDKVKVIRYDTNPNTGGYFDYEVDFDTVLFVYKYYDETDPDYKAKNKDRFDEIMNNIFKHKASAAIDNDVYIKHHYMAPVLNKVIVLIKSLPSNS
jgi:hypothetical protein